MLLPFFKKNSRNLIGIAIGAIAGWIYWHYVGCSSGTCAITSKPLNSTLYGAVIGYLVVGMLKKSK
jgi:phage shock protein E